ncbi:MAG: hypothetical protein R3F31_13785 [Verrucomicrobiales bacterium]
MAPGAATGKPGVAAVPPPPPAIEYVGNSPEDIGVMPEQKRPLQVKDTETNPFANRTAEVDEVVVVEDTSEEQSIRKVLQNIRVGGVSRGDGGLRILVGNIILEKGLILPQLVEDQRERLIVSDISENEVGNRLDGKGLRRALRKAGAASGRCPSQSPPSAPWAGGSEERREIALRHCGSAGGPSTGRVPRPPGSDQSGGPVIPFQPFR